MEFLKISKLISSANFELVGIPNSTGSIDTTIERSGQKYQLAGLKVKPTYFTLTQKAIDGFFAEFWTKANGEEFQGIDEENPDIKFLDGLLMEAIVQGSTVEERTILTDEEKAEKKSEGKAQVGEVITDGDGNPITRTMLNINIWLKKYTGDVPNPY